MDKSRGNTLSTIKQALLAIDNLQVKLKEEKNKTNEPIAIIGMACRFPGANSPNEFWELLLKGESGISRVNTERWDSEKLTTKRDSEPGKINTDKGGFIKDYDKFDAQFFGISPREAEKMDPQQRLLMEVSWEAFENAHINVEKLSGSKTGVFIGISTNDYSLIQFDSLNNDYSFIDAYQGSGNSSSIAANRLSYFYNFYGPSISIDSACSSSLVSTHLACQSLRNGDSKIALAGGVGLILSPHTSIAFSQAQMLSPDGECKTFDKDANGYVRGEGVGLIVLKKMSDAVKDGDNVLAIIKSSAVNQDGRTNGLTAPNSLSQFEVINEALQKANLSPGNIGYIETHGTGTKLGDPIEIEALSKIMKGIPVQNRCYLGAVKSNIGHLEAAAGIAGIIKTVLVLRNKKIPPNRNFKELNPIIKLNNSRLKIPTKVINWKSDANRRAGISSFGFGGTNAHIILEEYQAEEKISTNSLDHNLLTLSAFDESSIKNLALSYASYIKITSEKHLTNLCYSAALTRAQLGYRIVITFKDKNELVEKLDDIVNNVENYSVYKSDNAIENIDKIAFLFTGQGSQYSGMLKELYQTNKFFKIELDSCFSISEKYCRKSLKEIAFEEEDSLIHETEFTQPLLFIVEYVLAKYWIKLGIIPDYLLGHSIGEFAAACIAGVFDINDAIKLTSARGRLMQELPQNGSMVVVFSNLNTVNDLINDFKETVSIAAINGPNNIVISGLSSNIKKITDILSSKGIEHKKLKVSHAFHSPLMNRILDDFRKIASEVEYKSPKFSIVSTLTKEILFEDNIPDVDYWVKHVVESVKFDQGIRRLDDLGCGTYVEIGPNPVLIGMSKQIIDTNQKLFLTSISSKKGNWESINESLAQLYINKHNINWDEYYSIGNFNKIDIPNYQFKKERHYINVSLGKNKLIKNLSSGNYELYIKENKGNNTKIVQIVDENGNYINLNQAELNFFGEDEELPFNESIESEESSKSEIKNIDDLENDIKDLDETQQFDKIKNVIKNILGRILKINPLMLDTTKSITHLGLDSIMAIELKTAFENKFKTTLPIADLIKGPSIDELSLLIQSSLGNNSKVVGIKKVKRDGNIFPLSYGQKTMWFQQQMAPDSIFNPTYAVRIKSEINVDKFKYALEMIIQRHECLRTTYFYKNNEPNQIIHSNIDLPFEYHDCSNTTDDEIRKSVHKLANHKFDIEKGPVIITHLFKIANNDYIFLISSHHIAVDFWSQAIIVDELIKIYSSNNGVQLPELKYTYIDYIEWQKIFLQSENGLEQLNYWVNNLSGDLTNLDLPTIKPRPAVQTFNGSSEKLNLSKDLLEKVKYFCKETNSTQFTLLMSVFYLLLHKYTHQNDIIVGTPTSGRSNKGLNKIVSYFVNPIPIRTKIVSEHTFHELHNSVKSLIIDGIKNQDCPINLIFEKVKPERDVSRPPLFQVMFVYQNAHVLKEEGLSAFAVGSESAKMKLGNLIIESFSLEETKSAFEITLLAAETNDGISLTATYNTDLFNDVFIRQFLSNYSMLLEEVIAYPTKKIKAISLEQPKIYRGRETEIKDIQLVHKRFEQIVNQFPNNIAVQLKNKKITYAELNGEANQLANYLINLGLKPESRIGVFVDRSFEMIIAALGIMKAGYVYVPIDTTYPEERIKYIISNADISTIITVSRYSEKMNSFEVQYIKCDECEELTEKFSDNNPNVEIDDLNLAYSIYTSGSTGNPKGVLLTHIGLANLVENQSRLFEISHESKVLQLASFGFDASVSEIFTTITKGATLHLITQDVLLSGNSLLNEINNYKISVATIPPSFLSVIPHDKLESLRTLVSAGEACTKEVVIKWNNGRKFINAYGPTESTVCTTAYSLPKNLDCFNIPIGKAIDGLEIYVLDEYLNKVPNYVNGELYISGIGLARGYSNSPDQTAEKFLPNPFSNQLGSRMYKTGDLVRKLTSGELVFVGRIDDQIKFRGYRIELGEIKNALEKLEMIYQVEVVLDKTKNKLLSFYTSKNDEEIDLHELKNYLLTHIPEYMVPSNFIKVDTIPLTINGKVNKKELLKLSIDTERSEKFVDPINEIEKDILNVWKEILKVEVISTNDNFFDLGGHSLNVIQVQEKIKSIYDKDITVVDLFKYPTIKLFANYVSSNNDRSQIVEQINDRVNKQKQLLTQRAMLRNKK